MKSKKFTMQDFLCLFIILNPIFDIVSFIFRNHFETTVSISTFIRPILPIAVGIYIFIKEDKREKLRLALIGMLYILYAIAHLMMTKSFITGCSYGGVISEAQYICNFTFIIIDLIVYLYAFKVRKNDSADTKKQKTEGIEKLKKAITIMVAIYISSIFIAILTKTSSHTYIETKTGYKGWIESGNSLSAILTMSLFVVLGEVKSKNINWRIFSIITAICTGIYLTTTIGTRVGLFGTFIALALFIFLEVIFSKNKRVLICGTIIFVIGILAVTLVGSKTIQRRKQMNNAKYTIIDESTGEVGNMTGDMLKIKNRILEGTLEDGYMSEAQKQSVLDLYDYAKRRDLAGNNTRRQQLMYNFYLVKNQGSFLGIIFGNGFKTNFREMVMENELASFVLNFGILGFLLYVGPFIFILLYGFIKAIKDVKNLNQDYIMYGCALALSLVLSYLSGYVFFASSSMLVIVAIAMLILSKVGE